MNYTNCINHLTTQNVPAVFNRGAVKPEGSFPFKGLQQRVKAAGAFPLPLSDQMINAIGITRKESMVETNTVATESKSDDALSVKEHLELLIKEYEIHRREIDIRTDGTKNYGWPVFMVLVPLTVALSKQNGLKASVYELLPLLVPLLFMVVLALDANAKEAMDKARLQMARIEEKMKGVLGYYLFDAEITRVKNWTRPLSKFRVVGYTLLWSVCYIILIALLSDIRDIASVFCTRPLYQSIALILLAPLVFYAANRRLIYQRRFNHEFVEYEANK